MSWQGDKKRDVLTLAHNARYTGSGAIQASLKDICGDETWVSDQHPSSRIRGTAWITKGRRNRPSEVRRERATPKVLLILFHNSKGVVFREFLDTTLGSQRYLKTFASATSGCCMTMHQLIGRVSCIDQDQDSTTGSSSRLPGSSHIWFRFPIFEAPTQWDFSWEPGRHEANNPRQIRGHNLCKTVGSACSVVEYHGHYFEGLDAWTSLKFHSLC